METSQPLSDFQDYSKVDLFQNSYPTKLQYNPNVAFWRLPKGQPVALTEAEDGKFLPICNYEHPVKIRQENC